MLAVRLAAASLAGNAIAVGSGKSLGLTLLAEGTGINAGTMLTNITGATRSLPLLSLIRQLAFSGRGTFDHRRKIVVSGRRVLLLVVVLLLVLPIKTVTAGVVRSTVNTDVLDYVTVVIVDKEVFSGMVHLVALSTWRSVSQRLIFAMPSDAAELEACGLLAFRPLPLMHLGRQG